MYTCIPKKDVDIYNIVHIYIYDTNLNIYIYHIRVRMCMYYTNHQKSPPPGNRQLRKAFLDVGAMPMEGASQVFAVA